VIPQSGEKEKKASEIMVNYSALYARTLNMGQQDHVSECCLEMGERERGGGRGVCLYKMQQKTALGVHMAGDFV